MNAMIRDLVDSARLETGHLELNRRSEDLRPFVFELRERLGGLVEAERILMNLLSNALKYSPPETEVLVRAERVGGEVVTSVA